MSDSPFRDNPFVDAHAINALTDACRALNMTLVRAEERHRNENREMFDIFRRIADHTANLPALMDLLVTKRTNGQGHHEENHDDRPDGG